MLKSCDFHVQIVLFLLEYFLHSQELLLIDFCRIDFSISTHFAYIFPHLLMVLVEHFILFLFFRELLLMIFYGFFFGVDDLSHLVELMLVLLSLVSDFFPHLLYLFSFLTQYNF